MQKALKRTIQMRKKNYDCPSDDECHEYHQQESDDEDFGHGVLVWWGNLWLESAISAEASGRL